VFKTGEKKGKERTGDDIGCTRKGIGTRIKDSKKGVQGSERLLKDPYKKWGDPMKGPWGLNSSQLRVKKGNLGKEAEEEGEKKGHGHPKGFTLVHLGRVRTHGIEEKKSLYVKAATLRA